MIRRTIAIDFDGTLVMNAYPDIGEPNWWVIKRAIDEQQHGAALILWTCREGSLLDDAVKACAGWGLKFDAINESTTEWREHFGGRTRKVGATEYWDDKAVRIEPVLRSTADNSQQVYTSDIAESPKTEPQQIFIQNIYQM